MSVNVRLDEPLLYFGRFAVVVYEDAFPLQFPMLFSMSVIERLLEPLLYFGRFAVVV